MTMFIEDGQHPQWQFHKDYPWNEYKHLKRDKFEELVDLMIEAHPDHPLTEWLQRGFCMNDGDSTISFSSLEGYNMLQWDINHFDEEEGDCYAAWFGDASDGISWDEEW